MNNFEQLLAFALEGQKYALSLSSVEKVFRAVEITPLPKAPAIVLGIINVRGRVIPVVDIRKRFGFPEREIGVSDHLIVAQTPRRDVALVADRVDGVIEIDGREITRAEQILPNAQHVTGVVKLAGDLLLIHDLAGFLSLDEENALIKALKENTTPT